MRHRPSSVLSLCSICTLSLVAACSGAEPSGVTGGPAPSPSPTAPSGDAGPVDDSDAAAPRIDASLPDASGDDRIDPIEVGRAWTYDVTILGSYPLCKAGSHVGQVLGRKEVAGKQAFQVQSFCPGAGTSSYAVDGDKVEVYVSGYWVLALGTPVAEGQTWSNGLTSFTWEETGKVTVPAGTFDDCWTARQNASQSYTVFCRGVGPVRWHYVEGANGYDAVLTAKSF